MMVELRPAGRADTEAVIRLNKELIDSYEDVAGIPYAYVLGWVRDDVQKHIEEYQRIFLDGRHAGYVYWHMEGDKTALNDLFIFPEFQGQGIGTRVIRQCIAESEKTVSLHVFIKNEGAVRLYKRLGFEVMGEIRGTRYLMEYRK